jgi:hypothetical protein
MSIGEKVHESEHIKVKTENTPTMYSGDPKPDIRIPETFKNRTKGSVFEWFSILKPDQSFYH